MHHAVSDIAGRGMTVDMPNLSDACWRIARWLTNPSAKSSLLMVGGVGTGKTTLLRAVLRTMRQLDRYTSKMYVATDLQMTMISTPEIFRDSVLHGSWCSYLLLDDIGEEPVEVKDYGRTLPLFSKIVAERYPYQLPIMLTTNLSVNDIETRYGERTADRLREIADVMTFNNLSYRK